MKKLNDRLLKKYDYILSKIQFSEEDHQYFMGYVTGQLDAGSIHLKDQFFKVIK